MINNILLILYKRIISNIWQAHEQEKPEGIDLEDV